MSNRLSKCGGMNMPAYISIQCFTKYNKETFSNLLNGFRLALQDLGFPEYYIATHVDKVTWELSDNGFMYTGCNMPSEKINFNDNYFSIRPLIMGFTPEGCEGLQENWIEFALQFDEDEVTEGYRNGEMYDCIKKLIWTASNLLSKYFSDTAVYLTDEATDAFPWEALLGLYENIYSFDLAIVPRSYSEVYKHIPDEFKRVELNDKIYIAHMMTWYNELCIL